MEQNIKIEKKTKLIEVSVIVAIIIVMNMFFNYGVSFVYNEPVYNNYFPSNQIIKQIETEENCVELGGQWSSNVYTNEKKEPVISGYCDPNYTNQKNFEKDRNIFEKKVFITLIILSIISLVLAGFINISILSLSFGWGGVLSLLIASTRYWSLASNLSKLIILGIALTILIWLAVKKFNNK